MSTGAGLRLGRLGALAAALVVGAAAAGAWPTYALAGSPGLAAMAAGAVAAVVGALAGLLILVKRAQANRSNLAMIFLYTGPVRVLVTFLTAGAAWLIGRWPAASLLLWVAIFYLLLLASETIWLAGAARTK